MILHTAGQPADEQSMREAAQLAAYYSRARESQNVPVDYTPVRYVKKTGGGQSLAWLIYTTYRNRLCYAGRESGENTSGRNE